MRVLVIEDESKILSFIKRGLETEGFSVDAVASGEQGLFLAKTNDYDVAVLDIRLPDKNGIEICREIRTARKTFPILMLTVIGETKNKVEALNAGADDYLTKPFSFEEFLARIRALMRREKKITGDTIHVGDLALDSVAHFISRSGKEIIVTRKEFALLEYFMRNSGTLLTRGMILEHVWDMDIDPFTNTVDVHVQSLRRKLGESRGKKFINTVHGYGYRFTGERKGGR